MKKLLALVLAVVLSLGLASVAFADIVYTGDVQLTNDAKDENADYHVPVAGIKDGSTITGLWACFDGDTQSAIFNIYENDAQSYLRGADEKFIDFADYFAQMYTTEDEGVYTLPLNYKVTENAQYVKNMSVTAWLVRDGGAYYAAAFTVAITPIDYVIAENVDVKGYFYAYNNKALAADYLFTCYFEIELRNHYIDVAVKNADGSWVENNGSTYGYTGGNDLLDVYNAEKNLILYRHYGQANTSSQPSYVVYDEQFKASTKLILKATTFTYTGLVDITIADTYGQDGINFKYAEGKFAPTVAQLYANPDLAGYFFNFLSAETVESATTIVFNKANVAKYVGDTAYIYYSVDGKTYEALGTVDMKDAKAEVKVNLEAGDVLGYYLFLNSALEVAEEDTGKDNVGTGASDMTSVCVALAVVSLVAAGAVCVKKVSK